MRYLALDFAKPTPRYNIAVMWGLLLSVSLTMAFFVIQQQHFTGEIRRISQQKVGMQARVTSKTNPDIALQLSAAQETQRALNMPWEKMLSALEQAQQENPSIRLLSVQPKPEKGVILISGVTAEFDVLVKYLNSLRQQPSLGDAVLLNQHWEQDVSATSQDKLMFNLSVAWLP